MTPFQNVMSIKPNGYCRVGNRFLHSKIQANCIDTELKTD